MSRSPKSVSITKMAPATTTVILTGGGSGGHITPLLPLARALKKKEPGCQIIYIGLVGDKLEGLRNGYQIFDQVFYVQSGKFRRYHGRSPLARIVDIKSLVFNFRDLFRVLSGTFSSRRLLKRLRPEVVFSKGGYVALPVGLGAKSLQIPIVTHDSDATAGLTNRIIGRWAQVHATAMPAHYYDYPKDTVECVGIPLPEDIKPVGETARSQFKKTLSLPQDCLFLLICGGGLGSKRVNDLAVQIAPKLLAQLPDLYIMHITGNLHEKAVQAKYQTLLDEPSLQRIEVIGFSNEFSHNTGAADLVVARAGATTLAELQLQQKACVIIPAAFLTAGHQLKNAEILKQAGAAMVVSEDIEPQKLFELILDLLNDDTKRQKLAAAMAKLAHPRAADDLADIILNVAHRRRV